MTTNPRAGHRIRNEGGKELSLSGQSVDFGEVNAQKVKMGWR